MKWRGPVGGGAASGKMGSVVASHARGTQYLRARTTPVNPRSVFQAVIRGAVKTLTSGWQFLTNAQRTGWATYGTNVATVNTLGDPTHLAGVNWFVGNNAVRQQNGFGIINDAPTIMDRGNPNWLASAPVLHYGTGSTTGTLTFSGPIAAANATNGYLAVYMSRPYSAGRITSPGSNRLAATVVGGVTGGSLVFTLPFPAGGTVTKLDATLRLDQGDGRISSPFRATS